MVLSTSKWASISNDFFGYFWEYFTSILSHGRNTGIFSGPVKAAPGYSVPEKGYLDLKVYRNIIGQMVGFF